MSSSTNVKPSADRPLARSINIILQPILCDVSDICPMVIDVPAFPRYYDRQLPHVSRITGRWTGALPVNVADKDRPGINHAIIRNGAVPVGGGFRWIVIFGKGWRNVTRSDQRVPFPKTNRFRTLQHDLRGAQVFPGHPKPEKG